MQLYIERMESQRTLLCLTHLGDFRLETAYYSLVFQGETDQSYCSETPCLGHNDLCVPKREYDAETRLSYLSG